MRKLLAYLLFVVLMVSSFAGRAAEFGLGVALSGSGSGIFVPININEQWRVEPSLLYFESEARQFGGEFSNDFYSWGVGVFRLWPSSDQVRTLAGVRVSRQGFSQKDLKADGHGIAPAVGFEYAVTPRLVVGAEAALEYVDLDGEDAVGDPVRQTSTETRTAVTLKYFF